MEERSNASGNVCTWPLFFLLYSIAVERAVYISMTYLFVKLNAKVPFGQGHHDTSLFSLILSFFCWHCHMDHGKALAFFFFSGTPNTDGGPSAKKKRVVTCPAGSGDLFFFGFYVLVFRLNKKKSTCSNASDMRNRMLVFFCFDLCLQRVRVASDPTRPTTKNKHGYTCVLCTSQNK